MSLKDLMTRTLMIDPTIILAAGIGAIPGVLAYVSSRNTRRSMKDKVDKGAYEVAKEFYDDILKRSREDKAELVRDLEQAQQERRNLELRLAETNRAFESERQFLQHQLSELKKEIGYLKQRLREAGLEIDSRDPEAANSEKQE